MKTHMKTPDSEQGQVLVLIVLAIVGLFGLAALAIDFGQVFLARRSAQAAADAAALAAAFDSAAGSQNSATAVGIGYTMAGTNGYNNDGVNNWVTVNNPPVGDASCNICGAGNEAYYQVIITTRMSPIFAQFVFNGNEQTTVEAIARGAKSDSASGNDAVLALSESDDALNLSGTTKVQVTGGNIHSNGGLIKNGNSGRITVEAPGHVYYSSGFSGHTGPFTAASPEPGAKSGMSAVPAPYCPTAAERADGTWTSAGGYLYKTINGVNYYYYGSGLSVNNLGPGVHCIDGGIGKGQYTGTNVLVVLLSGGVQQTGGDSVDFRAASSLIDANGNQFGGLVFYAPPSNTSELKFGGNSGAYFYGTLLAPGAFCDIGGTPGDIAEHAAFVCDKFKIHGTPMLNIIYNPAELLHVASSVTLIR